MNVRTKLHSSNYFSATFNKGKGKSAKGVRGTAQGGSPAVSVKL